MKKTAITLLNLFLTLSLFAQTDKSGCEDHPVITRYPGAVIEYGKALEGTELTLSVTDLNGKLVWSQRITGEGNHVSEVWNTSTVPKGIYVYRLASQDGRYSLAGKIAIQK